jgi:hypothetical protein
MPADFLSLFSISFSLIILPFYFIFDFATAFSSQPDAASIFLELFAAIYCCFHTLLRFSLFRYGYAAIADALRHYAAHFHAMPELRRRHYFHSSFSFPLIFFFAAFDFPTFSMPLFSPLMFSLFHYAIAAISLRFQVYYYADIDAFD